MGAPTGFIFISYRRKDVPFAAHALHCHLARRFPERQLFMDVQGGIRAGLDFAEVIRDRVARCNVLLALIGPSWMQLADARLDDPGDFVRLEIASALDMRKRVIPILVENADMPRTHLLPENLRDLTAKHAMRLSQENFAAQIDHIVFEIQRALMESQEQLRMPLSKNTSEGFA